MPNVNTQSRSDLLYRSNQSPPVGHLKTQSNRRGNESRERLQDSRNQWPCRSLQTSHPVIHLVCRDAPPPSQVHSWWLLWTREAADTPVRWASDHDLVLLGSSEGRRGRELPGQKKSETNLHKIKSMKEHFCGGTISLQGRCASAGTVLSSVPRGHFSLTTCVRQSSWDEPLGSVWRGSRSSR